MKRLTTLALTLLTALNMLANGNVMHLTLDEAILLARTQSLDAAVALDELRSAYWQYRIYRAALLPEVNFQATAPSYSKSYNSYQNSDGTYTFVRNNYMQMNGRLSVQQNIWLTGGTLSLNSSLDYLKTLSGDKQQRYMCNPSVFLLRKNPPPFAREALNA
ncbi:MAG: TolC family protein [Oscillospiraceae bacterium]|nr:TolC family protein [Oscillospiraceae bacterium]